MCSSSGRILAMKTMLLTILMLCWSIGGWAFDGTFYSQLNAGAGLLNDADNSSADGTFITQSDPGVMASLSLGYALPESSAYHGGRVEIEAAWRQNAVDKVEFVEGKFAGDGDITAWSLLLCSYGERRNRTPWTPYFGAGLGVASISLDTVTVAGSPLADDDDLVLAYQVGLGVDYAINPRWKLDLGYRYFGTTSPSFKDATGEEFDGEYDNHSFMVGLRASF
ncbi:hypothetical protein C2E25_04695 [Geothermobacter hydrogeniphilus]|uniref:Outer membrane protein beta-barrel domain-containing protein n=2 Tax=Geothermobacter hydrogeniphilus TaxID=1969733 RepID=A0A2K2HCB7_9BACT|nr:hypothetical protein C2E25_04695 [Geothermobacter hydrogeniphilus]